MTKEVLHGNHSNNSFLDEESVSLIRHILSKHKRVMPNIDSQDKWPNIDGYLEIHDSSKSLIGKMEVQIKTLPKQHDYKFSCPMKFLHYCINVSTLPVLLLLVDNSEEKVYWIDVNKEFIGELTFTDTQKEKTIYLKKEQYFDKENELYIEHWEQIIIKHREKFKHYDELKEAYELLQQYSNPSIGKEDMNIVQMHQFLDELNQLLDTELNIVKKTLYPNQWKIGLAYDQYEVNSVRFTLYPIPMNKNDVLIKQINQQLHQQIESQGLGFTAHFSGNPIEQQPKKYAREIAKQKLLILINNRLLSHKGNYALATEFVFAFIDKFYSQLGLELKDEYTVDELNKAFNIYLPLWVEESMNFMIEINRNDVTSYLDCVRPNLYGNRPIYFDPDYIICQIMNEERELISKRVEAKLNENKYKILNFPLGNEKLPFGIFEDMLISLDEMGLKNIKRLYVKKDYGRTTGGWIWEVWSKEDTEKNIAIFVSHLNDVDETLLNNNLPLLRKELSIFKDANILCLFPKLKDSYEHYIDDPSYTMYHLKSENGSTEKSIMVIDEKKNDYLMDKFGRSPFEYTGQSYTLTSQSNSILDFIYEETPLLNYIYKHLEDAIKTLYNDRQD